MPNAAIHPTPQELTAFALGKLTDSATATVAHHLEKCPECRQAIEKVPADSFVGKVRAARPSVSSLPSWLAEAPQDLALPPKDLPPDLARYAKYRFLRELGRGGMGVVYQAEQTVMGRTVAVKVINPSVLDHPDALPRFQGEVKAAAKLDHPNIVRAYDAEQVGSMHLLVMEYVEGTSLAELVSKKGPLSVPYACHYVRQAALGLQHAFEQGMVHRDIKPQNLMVNARGQVKVLDFGLARMRSARKAGGGLTQVDAFMGTPEYVSPEQATDARSADTRADIYSLGCTLFFLLTGRPPFQEDTLVKLVLAQIEKEPPSLRDVRPEVPAELSAVVARMLAKDPARRFQKPIEVADALAAFVKAGPKGAAGSASPRSGASPPATGTMIAADTNQLKAILRDAPGMAPAPNAPAKEAATSAFSGLGEPAASAKKKAKPAQRTAKRGGAASQRSSQRTWLIGGSVAVGVLLLALLGMWASGVFKVKTKDGTIVLENLPRDAEVLVDDGTMTVKWRDGKTAEIRVAPGKKHRIQVKKEGFKVFGEEVEVDAGGSKPLLVRLEKPVARIVLQNLPADAEVFVDGAKVTVDRGARGKPAQIRVVAGRHKIVATNDGIDVLGEEVQIKGGELRVLRVTLSKDRGEEKWIQEVAALPAESQVKAVADKLKERNPGFDGVVKPTIENGVVTGLKFVTDNVKDLSPMRALPGLKQLLCEGSAPGKGKLADLSPLKGMSLATLWCGKNPVSDFFPLKGMPLTFLGCEQTPVSDLSPLKGMPLTILWCGNGPRISDLSPLKGMQLTSLTLWGCPVSDLSPLRGMPLTFLGYNNTKVTDLSPLKGMPLKELGCDFRPERDTEILRSIKTLEKINGKPAAQFWKEVNSKNTPDTSPTKKKDPAPRAVKASDYDLTGGYRFLHFGKDKTRVVLLFNKPKGYFARVYDLSTGKPITPPLQHGYHVFSAWFSPDGHRVVTGSLDQTARVWDAATGQAITPPLQHAGHVLHAVFSPDGKRVVTACNKEPPQVWDTETGKKVSQPLKHDGGVWFAAFSPDGRRVVTAGFNKMARIWDSATGKAITPYLPHEVWAESASFSPDSRRVVTASHFGTARVWDAATGKRVSPSFNNHEREIVGLKSWTTSRASFSPDGKRVVTSSADKTARIWNARTGQPITPPLQHGDMVSHASFSSDGKRVVTASTDKMARIWDAATGQPITPPLQHEDGVRYASFSPDGKRILTWSGDTAWVWDAETGKQLKKVTISPR